MSSPEPALGPEAADTLLDVARASIESGLEWGRELDVDPLAYAPELRRRRACFVTLRIRGELRGCTGTLEATAPLVVDVAHNAWRSAFGDPRFAALARDELLDLDVHLSILSPLEPLPVASEEELLRRLRPGVDGLVLREVGASSTFLPAVWKALPVPEEFLRELKRKAGLPPDYRSRTLHFERYTAEEIGS